LLTDESDERLMLRYQAGEERAFEVLLGRHRGPVHNFLVRLAGDRARAEDLLQETWLKVVSAAPRWERKARFTTWLYAIARNVAVDEARRAAHRKADPLDGPADPGRGGRSHLETVADGGAAPDRAAESALLRPRLEAALRALPDEQREVFVLREYAGLPFAEIAEVTGTPENTVKSRMRYALEALRRKLEELGVEPGLAGEAPRSARR
jgi:RNA polymerase sigma-70 factor (ECF subfamily)